MTWQLFRLAYELLSPLHIGYHKVGNVQRTRYYLPARNLWGAITEHLTRSGFQAQGASQGDYRKIGEWVKTFCRFSYFFVSEDNGMLAPRYQDNCLYYGNLTHANFERCYLEAHVATALDTGTVSAAEGSLHEVEFISPYPEGIEKVSRHTCLTGWVFLKGEAVNTLGTEQKWRTWLGELHVGGERRYGFGHLCLLSLKTDSTLNGLSVELEQHSPCVCLQTGNALPAHVIAQGIQACGAVEPLVGRETSRSNAFGRTLTQGIVCWVPGSLLTASVLVQLGHNGYWRSISKG